MKTIFKCKKMVDGEWVDVDFDDYDWSTINDIIVKGEYHYIKGQWIPCEEQLPQSDDWVLVTILDESGDTPYRYTDFGWYLDRASCWIIGAEQRTDVIAWMPLPKPYKVD